MISQSLKRERERLPMMALIEEISKPNRPPPMTATAAITLMFPTVYMAAAHHPAGE
jgi:hypothetical protein